MKQWVQQGPAVVEPNAIAHAFGQHRSTIIDIDSVVAKESRIQYYWITTLMQPNEIMQTAKNTKKLIPGSGAHHFFISIKEPSANMSKWGYLDPCNYEIVHESLVAANLRDMVEYFFVPPPRRGKPSRFAWVVFKSAAARAEAELSTAGCQPRACPAKAPTNRPPSAK